MMDKDDLEVGQGTSSEVTSSEVTPNQPNKKPQFKRKPGEWSRSRGKRRGRYHSYQPPRKKLKTAVSSKRAANSIMKFRLGGSVSDPLNLEGADHLKQDSSPSSAMNEEVESRPPLPPQLQKDPLNLEGKVKNFPLPGVGGGQRKKPRRRTTSGSKADDGGTSEPPKPHPKDRPFHYGNYNRYYSYRNSGVHEIDPRFVLFQKEWFSGQDCLDIGCNTGQITINLAKEMNPRQVVGIDIDHNLVKMAWKNLHRSHIPSLTPDGQLFPSSLTMNRGPVHFPTVASVGRVSSQCSLEVSQLERGTHFPHNIQFVEGNYVPKDDYTAQTQAPEYDVILALSLTKWVHLNWGDSGIKRFFKKVYHHLRPGGRFILEPQPYTSYSKRKNLTAEIFGNYQSIKFHPEDFQRYLLSSEVGFAHHRFLGIPQSKYKGFQRPLHMYTKQNLNEVSVLETLVVNCIGEEKERLKSVVIPVKDCNPNT